MHTQQDVTHTDNKWVNEETPVNITTNTQQSNMQDNITMDGSPNLIAINNEQKENPNYMPIHIDWRANWEHYHMHKIWKNT